MSWGEALRRRVVLVRSHGQSAVDGIARGWRLTPGGGPLIAAHPKIAQLSPDFTQRAEELVRRWQGEVLQMVRDEAAGKRTTARFLAFGVNGLAVMLMLIAFSATYGLSGAEVGIAGGSAVVAQRLLEALFGDQAVRTLSARARKRLLDLSSELYEQEKSRYLRVLEDGATISPEDGGLRHGHGRVEGGPPVTPILGRHKPAPPRSRRAARPAQPEPHRGARSRGVPVARARRGAGACAPGQGAGAYGHHRLAHGRRPRGGHRLRQVVALQRTGGRTDLADRRSPPDDVLASSSDLGGRAQRGPAGVVGCLDPPPGGRRSPRAADLDGMVLLDLPDFDSNVAQHRAEADRVLELADVFVWVTDPQKYADAVMHDEYISRLAGHDAVTFAVLNQVDLLQRAQVGECVADLKRLLVADGLADVQIIPTSAARGHGVDDVVSAVAQVVQQHNAAEQRLLGDLTVRATGLRAHVGDSEPPVQDAGPELDRALAQAAGVPVVLDAVERDYLMRSAQHGGWPFTRWITKLRPAPLSRLGLDRVVGGGLTRLESSSVLGRSSLPPPTPASRAAVDVATRELAERACVGLPQPWADAVQDAAAPDEKLYDELDRAVMGVPLRGRIRDGGRSSPCCSGSSRSWPCSDCCGSSRCRC